MEQNNNTNHEISELRELLEKNIKLSEDVLALSQKINSFVMWQKVFGVVKTLVIFIPLFLGALFLPPLLKDVLDSYQELLGVGDSLRVDDIKNINDLPDNIRQYIK